MKSWLRYCMYNGHSKCLPAQTGTPTRLLFVDESEIILIHTSTIANQPLYFTLSHCWGTIDILKLTRENIDDMQREIRETELCQTFRDAINVTRMLGFSYIWIDSLCIIQDDVEDWRKEASRMSDVYGGSTLNLAASGAQDGRGVSSSIAMRRRCNDSVVIKSQTPVMANDAIALTPQYTELA